MNTFRAWACPMVKASFHSRQPRSKAMCNRAVVLVDWMLRVVVMESLRCWLGRRNGSVSDHDPPFIALNRLMASEVIGPSHPRALYRGINPESRFVAVASMLAEAAPIVQSRRWPSVARPPLSRRCPGG